MALAISHLLFTAASVKLTLWLSLCMSNFSLDFFFFFFNTSKLHSLENSYNENADAVLTTAHQYEHAAIIGFCDLHGLC